VRHAATEHCGLLLPLLLQHCCLSQAAHLQRGAALLLEVLHQVRHHRLAAVNACLRANLNPAPDMTDAQDGS
jgi:hypothetical protein